jgi:hypothetical protein
MSPAPTELWIGRGNDQLGPHALARIRQLHAEGALRADDLLWWDGLEGWIGRDQALTLLGFEALAARPLPPPIPVTIPVPPVASVPPQSASIAAAGPSPERRRALIAMFAGLVLFAVLAAAAFSYLRDAGFRVGFAQRADMVEALASVAMYRTAYAEYAVSTGQVPQSLDEIGMGSAPYGPITGVRLELGTLLFDTRDGVLAVQPYRNDSYQIWFRCGHAAPPAGMAAMGSIDASSATTLAAGDLPDDCR